MKTLLKSLFKKLNIDIVMNIYNNYILIMLYIYKLNDYKLLS